jgi:hypothetical protein
MEPGAPIEVKTKHHGWLRGAVVESDPRGGVLVRTEGAAPHRQYRVAPGREDAHLAPIGSHTPNLPRSRSSSPRVGFFSRLSQMFGRGGPIVDGPTSPTITQPEPRPELRQYGEEGGPSTSEEGGPAEPSALGPSALSTHSPLRSESSNQGTRRFATLSPLRTPSRRGSADSGAGTLLEGERDFRVLRTPSPLSRRRSRLAAFVREGEGVDVLYHAPGLPNCGVGLASGSATIGHGGATGAFLDALLLDGGSTLALGDGSPAAARGRGGAHRVPAAHATVGSHSHGPGSQGLLPHGKVCSNVWLPGVVVQISGDLVRVLVYVPPAGIAQNTRQVAAWLKLQQHAPPGTPAGQRSREASPVRRRGGGLPAPHVDALWLHISEVPLRISRPPGLRSGVSGAEILSLWPASEAAEAGPLRSAAVGAHAPLPRRFWHGESAEDLLRSHEAAPHGTRRSSICDVLATPLAHAAGAPGTVERTAPHARGAGSVSGGLYIRAPLRAASSFEAAPGHAPSIITQGAERSTASSFLSTLRPGLEVDVKSTPVVTGSGPRPTEEWAQGIVLRLRTDAALLATIRAEDRIGRHGFPALPKLIALDLWRSSDGLVETVPIASGRLAPAGTRTGSGAGVRTLVGGSRLLAVGREVDIVHFEADPAADDPRATRAHWRRGRISSLVDDVLHVLYRDDAVEGLPLLTDSCRLRAVGESCAAVVAPSPLPSGLARLPLPLLLPPDRPRPPPSMPPPSDCVEMDAVRWATDERAFASALSDGGWCTEPQGPEKPGSLFTALAQQVYGDPCAADGLRQLLVDHERANAELWSPIIDDLHPPTTPTPPDRLLELHLDRLEHGTNGGYAELLAVEEVADRPVAIFNAEEFLTSGSLQARSIHLPGELPKEWEDAIAGKVAVPAPIRLAYHGDGRYSSLIPIGTRLRAAEEVVPPLRGTATLLRLRRERGNSDAVMRHHHTAADVAAERSGEVLRRHLRYAAAAAVEAMQWPQ